MKIRRLLKFLPIVALLGLSAQSAAEDLVILHTNDTHSIIDPGYDDNLGGVMRRKALIDSVRRADKNVILVDAGDVVQGSLYFTLFGGDAEKKIMNELGYDIMIPGNHEFDNGLQAMANYYRDIKADRLSANYDFRGTPLEGMFEPYTIRTIDGRRIGFIGINVDPRGLIDSTRYEGMKYIDDVEAANLTAEFLKKIEHCDYVIALTHIGYENTLPEDPSLPEKRGDADLARNSRNIDIIIGGHSHTTIDPTKPGSPAWRIPNLDGDTVLVAQTGRYGRNLGEIVLNLDNGHADYRLIPVNSRLDGYVDPKLQAIIAPYKHPVDSIRAIPVGYASEAFPRNPQLCNWMADFVLDDARHELDRKADFALINTGGVRNPFVKGPITKGEIMQAFPFDNRITVVEVPGSVVETLFRQICDKATAQASRNVSLEFDRRSGKLVKATINGKPVNPNKTYRIATIDYLANGNDGFSPIKDCRRTATSPDVVYDDMIRAMETGWMKGKKQTPDPNPRIKTNR